MVSGVVGVRARDNTRGAARSGPRHPWPPIPSPAARSAHDRVPERHSRRPSIRTCRHSQGCTPERRLRAASRTAFPALVWSFEVDLGARHVAVRQSTRIRGRSPCGRSGVPKGLRSTPHLPAWWEHEVFVAVDMAQAMTHGGAQPTKASSYHVLDVLLRCRPLLPGQRAEIAKHLRTTRRTPTGTTARLENLERRG